MPHFSQFSSMISDGHPNALSCGVVLEGHCVTLFGPLTSNLSGNITELERMQINGNCLKAGASVGVGRLLLLFSSAERRHCWSTNPSNLPPPTAAGHKGAVRGRGADGDRGHLGHPRPSTRSACCMAACGIVFHHRGGFRLWPPWPPQ